MKNKFSAKRRGLILILGLIMFIPLLIPAKAIMYNLLVDEDSTFSFKKIKIKKIEEEPVNNSYQKIMPKGKSKIKTYIENYPIIPVRKARHDDSNGNFMSDIYLEVRELDGIWSETINNNEYIRVTFEKNLTSERDITIYPRIISGDPRIEVYEIGSNLKIAEFTLLKSNKYNKVFLNNLQESQDTFDLRVIDGSVKIDYIVDPGSTYDYNSGQGTLHFVYESPNSGGTFPPLWTDGWGGTQIGSYMNVQTDNTAYITQVGGSNTEPYFRFNFTIAETPADINWIFVNINGFSTYDGGEDARCFVANFNTQVWDEAGQMPTTDGDINFNITSSITNYIDGDQLVYLCFGKNLDAVDELSIDYIQVTVDYTADTTPPQWSSNSTNSTLAGSTVSHRVFWTEDVGFSGYIFSFNNGNGSFLNDTFVAMDSSNWTNVSKVVNSTVGSIINWSIYVNDSSNNLNVTSIFNYTTTEVSDSCTCTDGVSWTIINNDQCTLTTSCNLGTGTLRVMSGALRIASTGFLNANHCYVQNGNSLFVINGGRLICR